MRKSTYEIILPLIGANNTRIDGKMLLANGLYGAVDVVDEAAANALGSGDIASLPLALREKLTARGHITIKTEIEEEADARLLGRIFRKTIGHAGIGPVILPTYDCNFRCPYCFERRRLSNGADWLANGMKPEMIDAVFRALKAQREKGYHISRLTLYGGEPLLKENISTVRRICERAAEMGLSISAVTNGFDVDFYIELMREFHFSSLQITVDGVGEVNDLRRLHRDGIPTYERIMSNIGLALDSGIDVSLRVNVNA